MDIKYLGDNIIEIDGKVRVEVGPARVTAIATTDMLDDKVTAAHYQISQPRFDPDDPKKQIGWSHIDAVNQPIVLGKSMTYIDWKGLLPPVHYLYALETFEELNEKTGKKVKIDRWMSKGSYSTEAEALSVAASLSVAKGA